MNILFEVLLHYSRQTYLKRMYHLVKFTVYLFSKEQTSPSTDLPDTHVSFCQIQPSKKMLKRINFTVSTKIMMRTGKISTLNGKKEDFFLQEFNFTDESVKRLTILLY